MEEKNAIQIDFLDHVAIRVKDMAVSAQWYQKVFVSKKWYLNTHNQKFTE